MRVVFISAVFSAAMLLNASAQTRVSKIECVAPQAGVTIVLEINFKTKLVRTWTKSDTHTDGPIGPSSASITRQKIVWKIIRTVGSAMSRTTYTLDLKKRTLTVVDSGPGADKLLHTNVPCTATS